RRERPRDTESDITEAETATPTRPKSKRKAARTGHQAKQKHRAAHEPTSSPARPHQQAGFVVLEHQAARQRFELRLEVGGVLKVWVVTNEPSLDPAVKRLAVRVEDRPLADGGIIDRTPQGQDGAAEVSVWDRGMFENLDPAHTVVEGLDAGKLS